MSTRVYAYGCAQPSKEACLAIRSQLLIAYRYRLALWRLAMAKRTHYRERRCHYFPELEELDKEIVLEKELLEKNKKDKELRSVYREHCVRAKLLRDEAKTHPSLLKDVEFANLCTNILSRALRKAFSQTHGLYTGTYMHVEAAAAAANAGREDPVRPRWRGTEYHGAGALALQIQGGRTAEEIFSGLDPSLQVVKPVREGKSRLVGSRTTAKYRVRSENRHGVMVDLRVMWHRDLPPDAVIVGVKLVVTPVHAYRYEYSLQLTVRSDIPQLKSKGVGTVAVCFANDTVLCLDNSGSEFVFANFEEPLKLRDLQSIRDKNRNEAIKSLGAYMSIDWIHKEILEIEELAVTRVHGSCRRLFDFREKLRSVVDAQTVTALDAWAYQENHLYWWFADMRKNALRHRKDTQRVFAAKLRSSYATILLDNRKLDDRKRLNASNRWLGLHELRTALAQSFGEDTCKVLGDTCDEMFVNATTNTTPTMPPPTKSKRRTGYAQKHSENKSRTML